MVDSLNGASYQQTAIANPFQQRDQQTRQAGNDDRKTGQSQKAGQVFTLQRNDAQGSKSVLLSPEDKGEKTRSASATRGSLVDITV